MAVNCIFKIPKNPTPGTIPNSQLKLTQQVKALKVNIHQTRTLIAKSTKQINKTFIIKKTELFLIFQVKFCKFFKLNLR
jgi:hypothetical protein